jgi:hypothetical protein
MPARLPDEQQWIVDELGRGNELIGPVRVPRHRSGCHSTEPRPWGFRDGKRANRSAIESLERRGLLQIRSEQGSHRAELSGRYKTEKRA